MVLMTLSDDIAAHRALAETATPGPWKKPHGMNHVVLLSSGVEAALRDNRPKPDGWQMGATAAFIAAHDPELVRALWDVAEAMQQVGATYDPDDPSRDVVSSKGHSDCVSIAAATLDRLTAVLQERSS